LVALVIWCFHFVLKVIGCDFILSSHTLQTMRAHNIQVSTWNIGILLQRWSGMEGEGASSRFGLKVGAIVASRSVLSLSPPCLSLATSLLLSVYPFFSYSFCLFIHYLLSFRFLPSLLFFRSLCSLVPSCYLMMSLHQFSNIWQCLCTHSL